MCVSQHGTGVRIPYRYHGRPVGVNAVSFSPEGKRLFIILVFYGDALYELDRSGAAPGLVSWGL